MMRQTISIEYVISALLIVNGLLFTIEDSLHIPIHIKPFFLVASLLLCFYSSYFTNAVTQLKTFIGLSFLGSELLLFLLPILFLPKFLLLYSHQSSLLLNKLQFVVVIFLMYCALLFVFTYVPDFSFFNIFLWFIIFAASTLFFIYYSRSTYNQEDASSIFNFFYRLILLQIVIVSLQSLIHRDFRPGDSWTGSSGNSVIVGFFLFLLLIFRFIPYFIRLNRNITWLGLFSLKNVVILTGISILLYFNDSKMVILCFVLAIILYFLFLLVIRFLTSFKFHLFLKSLIVSLILIVAFGIIHLIANIYGQMTYDNPRGIANVVSEYFNPELNEHGTNAKFVLYKRIYHDAFKDDFWAWLFGVGPGKLGSKASNIMAYDILYKDESQVKLPSIIGPYSSTSAKKYMADLWTKKIAETSRFRSATLSFPFAGLVTIKGEYGLLGLAFYLFVVYSFSYYLIKKAYYIHDWKLKNWAITLSIFWFSLPLHMVFDNFQEKPYIMLPMFLTSAVIYSLKNDDDE